MGKRNYRLEFERTTYPYESKPDGEMTFRSQWYWRFIATNGKELARSSETYKRRVDAIASAEATTGCLRVRRYEAQGFCVRPTWRDDGPEDDGMDRVNVRWLR